MHLIINGTMGNVAGSPNDPIFFNHHTMIDCLLERWLELQPTLNYPDLPGQQKSAFAGHGPGDCLVPFIPLYTNNDMFKLSTEFGYTCDLTLQEAATSQSPPSDGSQSTPASSQPTPDSSQGTPDSSQQTPASSQQTPDRSQGTPDSSQGTPDSSQGTPDNSQGPPDNSQETPNGHQGTPPGQSTNGASHYHIDSAVFAMLALAFSFVAYS